MSATINVFVLVTIACIFAIGEARSSIKLSDLPALKRWEISTKSRDHLERLGRKYKNLDGDVKRNQEWEAAADVTPYDLGPAEDPQRVSQDLHNPYWRDIYSTRQQQQNDILTKKGKTKQPTYIKDIRGKPRDSKNSRSGKRRRLIALKPFLPKEQNSKKRNKRSLDSFPSSETDGLYEEEESSDEDFEDYDNEDSQLENETTIENREKDEEMRIRRAIDIGNAIKRAKIIQSRLSNVKNIQSNDARKNNKKTMASSSAVTSVPHEENLVKLVAKSQRSKTETNSNTNKRSNSISRNGSKQKPSGSVNDQKKDKTAIQRSFFTDRENGNTVRHIIPQRSSISHASPVDVKVVPKNHLDNFISSSSPSKEKSGIVENNPVYRQHIPQPKEQPGINTANVARAVAVAMEQLKRDKMWGKVFVHVQPSGELKVMVQETRKMSEDSE